MNTDKITVTLPKEQYDEMEQLNQKVKEARFVVREGVRTNDWRNPFIEKQYYAVEESEVVSSLEKTISDLNNQNSKLGDDISKYCGLIDSLRRQISSLKQENINMPDYRPFKALTEKYKKLLDNIAKLKKVMLIASVIIWIVLSVIGYTTKDQSVAKWAGYIMVYFAGSLFPMFFITTKPKTNEP